MTFFPSFRNNLTLFTCTLGGYLSRSPSFLFFKKEKWEGVVIVVLLLILLLQFVASVHVALSCSLFSWNPLLVLLLSGSCFFYHSPRRAFFHWWSVAMPTTYKVLPLRPFTFLFSTCIFIVWLCWVWFVLNIWSRMPVEEVRRIISGICSQWI